MVVRMSSRIRRGLVAFSHHSTIILYHRFFRTRFIYPQTYFRSRRSQATRHASPAFSHCDPPAALFTHSSSARPAPSRSGRSSIPSDSWQQAALSWRSFMHFLKWSNRSWSMLAMAGSNSCSSDSSNRRTPLAMRAYSFPMIVGSDCISIMTISGREGLEWTRLYHQAGFRRALSASWWSYFTSTRSGVSFSSRFSEQDSRSSTTSTVSNFSLKFLMRCLRWALRPRRMPLIIQTRLTNIRRETMTIQQVCHPSPSLSLTAWGFSYCFSGSVSGFYDWVGIGRDYYWIIMIPFWVKLLTFEKAVLPIFAHPLSQSKATSYFTPLGITVSFGSAKILVSGGPYVTSPFTILSPYFQKSGSPLSFKILMLVTLPALHPSKLSKIFLETISNLTLGLVILTIFSMRWKLRLNCFSTTLQALSAACIFPTPNESTSPFMVSLGSATSGFPPHFLDKIAGYLEAPQAQSTKSPTFPLSLSSQADPASTGSSYFSLLPSKRTISAISAYIPKSSALESPWYFLPQLQAMVGLPSCTQMVRSMGQVRQRQCNPITAALLLHSWFSPIGRSFSTLMPPGWVGRVPLLKPEGLAMGKKMVLAASSCPQALRRMLGLVASSPLSPATSSTVKLVCFVIFFSLFSERKQKSSHGDGPHISLSLLSSFNENIPSLGTFFCQRAMASWY